MAQSHTVTDLAKTVAEQLQVSAHEITFQVLPTSTQADPTLQELKIADNTVLTARRLLQVHVALPGVRLPAQVKIFAVRFHRVLYLLHQLPLPSSYIL